jgi:hypothetical protein
MTTALEHLKHDGLSSSTISRHLASFLHDKGYNQIAERLFALPTGRALLSQLIGQFLLRLPPYEAASVQMRQSIAAGLCGEGSATYFGTIQENAELLQSLTSRGHDDDPFLDEPGQASPVGAGVARHFSLRGFRLGSCGVGARIARTPIVFIGAGPATILLARTLMNAGFRQLTVIDPSGEYGGIWRQKNVRLASRNNPSPMSYETIRTEAAPGGGEEITRFLATLASPPRAGALRWHALPPVIRGRVVHVEPGDLARRICYVTRNEEHILETPLLIAAPGLGKPLAPSRPGVMTTDTPQEAGIRWQQLLSLEQAQALQGKTVVLIGLGNSTAEMLIQLHRYRDAGLDLRFKVLTHYPREAIRYPNSYEILDGAGYRLFREPREGQLTSLAGDLEPIRQAFERLRDSHNHTIEELITDVTHWSLQQSDALGPQMVVTLRNGHERRFACDQLYTLIGYGHPRETLESLGFSVLNPAVGTIAADYDGEVQRAPVTPGRGRLSPGYFAAGALLKAPGSENVQVIPGMLYRLHDQLFSLCLRAAEYALLRKPRMRCACGNE